MMQVEVNTNMLEPKDTYSTGRGGVLLVTPPIGEDFWLMRVPLSEKQAIVCFPKFLTVGIGFQIEKDWNTNLPYTSNAEKIFAHIKHNKGDEAIADTDCIEAIRMLQEAIKTMIDKKGEKNVTARD